MKRFLLILLFSLHFSVQAQTADSIYSAVRIKYESLCNLKDSVVVVKFLTKSRYTDKAIRINRTYVYQLKNMDRYNPEFNVSVPYYIYHIKNNIIKYKWIRNDTFKYLTQEFYYFDLKSKKKENGLHKSYASWGLTLFPTDDHGDFSKAQFDKPILLKYSSDTIIIKQKWKKNKQRYRNIYINKDFEIYKIENFNLNEEESDEYVGVEFTYSKKESFLELSKKYQFGNFTDTPAGWLIPKKEIEKDSINKTTKILSLLNKQKLILNNKYILFDYWYLNCGPCQQMMPLLSQIEARIDTSKIQIVGVNQTDKEQNILTYLNKRNYHLPQLDCNFHAPLHTIYSFPTLVLLDSNFNEVKRWVGYSPAVKLEIEHYLKKLGVLN